MVSVTEHERALRTLPCCVSGQRPVTLHHCHGGSISDSGWSVGMGQKQNPYLQIPLLARFHWGDEGIDSGMGVRSWERKWGAQIEHLAAVEGKLGYRVWPLAVAWELKHRGKSIKVRSQA